jgi:hypothetical protein
MTGPNGGRRDGVVGLTLVATRASEYRLLSVRTADAS